MIERIFEEIAEELKRAKIKHPLFPKSLVRMTAIMAEEAGEAIKEANLIEDEGRNRFKEYKEELIQTAAMCVRILEILEMNK